MSGINSFFTPESTNSDGGVTFFSQSGENFKSFYLTNFYGDKILKFAIKSEATKSADENQAQIKIISYGIKSAYVWKDQPNDPYIERLSQLTELTYHGVSLKDKKPKIHIKAQSKYKTLIDNVLHLPEIIELPVPLFAVEPGYKSFKRNADVVKNRLKTKSHIICIKKDSYERVDFYLASANINMNKFINSIYLFNLFWTQDYLSKAKGNVLSSGLIIAPIHLLSMGGFFLLVRRSLSLHQGRPRLLLYNNKDYYNKLMSRPVAYQGLDGALKWSTMMDEELRLNSESKG